MTPKAIQTGRLILQLGSRGIRTVELILHYPSYGGCDYFKVVGLRLGIGDFFHDIGAGFAYVRDFFSVDALYGG